MDDPPATRPDAGRSRHLAPADAGQRLDVLLAAWLGTSRAEVRRLLAAGSVSLDARPLRLRDKGLALPAAGLLTVDAFTPPAQRRIRPDRDAAGVPRPPPKILSHGDGWLALDKPAGVPVHPLREDESGSLLSRLVAHYPQIQGVGEGGLRSGVVHRLDVETSGVLLVATSQSTWQWLRRGFREHRIEKVYRAIVAGDLQTGDRALELSLPLRVARHRPARVRVVGESEATSAGARRAQQSVRRLERLAGASLVEVRPRTGHLHQIRVSLAHVGHPVLGDRVYRDRPELLSTERACGAARHLLHASRIAFEEVVAESPDPPDFVAALAKLRGRHEQHSEGAGR
jgi:23S rRNA pseudouridine1911/1915/1917 synthase